MRSMKRAPLLVLREVEEELDDARPVRVQVLLETGNRAVALWPDGLRISLRNSLGGEDLRMHAHDQHLLIVGAVENADPAAFRKVTCGAPQEVVLQLRGARMLEAEYLASLGVDARHHMLDGAVLPRRIHGLEDQEHRVAVRRVQQFLAGAQLRNVTCEHLLVFILRVVRALDPGGPFLQVHLLARRYPEIARMYLHGANFPLALFPTGARRIVGCVELWPQVPAGTIRTSGARPAPSRAASA